MSVHVLLHFLAVVQGSRLPHMAEPLLWYNLRTKREGAPGAGVGGLFVTVAAAGVDHMLELTPWRLATALTSVAGLAHQ